MHTLLCQIKSHIETSAPIGSENWFKEYRTMGISPIHVHRSKAEHKRAIFVLGKEISAYLANGEYSGPARMSARLADMLQKMDKAQGLGPYPTVGKPPYARA
jgi:hypothetical protein